MRKTGATFRFRSGQQLIPVLVTKDGKSKAFVIEDSEDPKSFAVFLAKDNASAERILALAKRLGIQHEFDLSCRMDVLEFLMRVAGPLVSKVVLDVEELPNGQTMYETYCVTDIYMSLATKDSRN